MILAYAYGGYVYLDSPELQELLGAQHGLTLARRCAVRNVELVMDSLDMLQLIEGGRLPPYPQLEPVPPLPGIEEGGFISLPLKRIRAQFKAAEIDPVERANALMLSIYHAKLRAINAIRGLVDFFSADGRQIVMNHRLREQNFLADSTTKLCELPTVGPVYVFRHGSMPKLVVPFCLTYVVIGFVRSPT